MERSACTAPATGESSRACAPGLAAYFGVDPTLVRLAFALVTVFGGLGVLIYLCAWIVIPEEGGDGSSIAETFVNKRRS